MLNPVSLLLAKQVAVIPNVHSLGLRKNDISEMPVRSHWQERVSLSCSLTLGLCVCVCRCCSAETSRETSSYLPDGISAGSSYLPLFIALSWWLTALPGATLWNLFKLRYLYMVAYMCVLIHIPKSVAFLLKQKTFNEEKCKNLASIDISSQSEIEMSTFSLQVVKDPLFLI